jgi:exopolyphosphatase/guanosine-5'-triphosphate,3'-diphosphate pyrophosphatase
VRELANSRMIDHARVLGATMRVAYLVSGAMPGVLPNTPLVVERGKLKLKLSGKYRDLAGERVFARLKQLARLIGRDPVMVAE